MGYNIGDVGGEAVDGVDVWNATLDLDDPGATTISGDFDVTSLFDGSSLGEATDGYVFSGLSDPTLGSLSVNNTTGEYTFTVDRSAVFATGADQVVSFTVTGTSGANFDTDTVVITILICVARGTRITCARGEIAVEDLEVGDLVTTMDGKPQPVRWIGSRRVERQEMESNTKLWPVRIVAHALGENVPRKDLIVSAQHRVFLQDWRAELLFGEHQVLVPAKSLINDHSIVRDRNVDGVEYFHLLFDEHQIIFTENAPTESFHPGAYTLSELDKNVRDELFQLFPELKQEGGYGGLARYGLKQWEAKMLTKAPDWAD